MPRFRIGLALVLLLLVVPGVAQADPYSPPSEGPTEPATEPVACPSPELGPYEGTDHGAGELRLLRGELVEICKAITERLDDVRERTWWAVAEALAASDQRVVTNTVLSEVRDRLAAPVPVKVDGSVETESAVEQQYTDQIATAVDASGSATKEALWFLIGLTCLIAGAAFYRWVKP